jgi:DNA ligase (NAD+)
MYTFFSGNKSPFSNWYPSTFTVDEQTFSCSEQYMMWAKAKLFKDEKIAQKILSTSSPKEHKALGRKVHNFDPKVWDKNKENIVFTALKAKFSQNPQIMKQLQKTAPTLLVEASPWDRIWGIGYSEKEALQVGTEKWGENLLGKLLTQVRDENSSDKMEKLSEKINLMNMTDLKKYFQTENLDILHKLRLYLDDIYYNTGDSVVEDIKYDLLKDTIKTRDAKFVPTVGATLREGENRVELPFWLGSADKITPSEPDELRKWIKNNPSEDFVISEKLDGVSCLLVKKDDELKLYTRGNGLIGADISYLAKYFNIPQLTDNIAVRGELIMPKEVFEKKHKGTYKNPRNMVSGLIGGKTSRKGLQDVHYVVYEIVGDSMPKPSGQLKKLSQLGFEVVNHEVVKSLSVDSLTKTLLNYRQKSPYELDGIIVQANQSYDRNTSGNPEYMFAFKVPTESFSTTVIAVEWNISKWGQLKPVVIVEPVEAAGVTMTRVTAHNAKYVEENNLGPGAVIRITRSKEVIPYIVEVEVQADEPQMPDIEYIWDKNHVNISVKKYDDTMCIKLIAGFFAKLGIKHVSEATIAKMFANGLDNLLKIVSADKKRLLKVPEFQEKSAERIYTNIHNGLQNVKISTILGASGVLGFGIGSKRMDALLLDIPQLLSSYKKKPLEKIRDEIMAVPGFSFITADKISKNLKYADLLIQKLSKYASFKTETRVSEGLKGQKIVMTGFRDKKLEEDISQRGGKVVGTVSKNTTILVVAKKEGKLTGKLQKASELGIPIYEKAEFISQYINE